MRLSRFWAVLAIMVGFTALPGIGGKAAAAPPPLANLFSGEFNLTDHNGKPRSSTEFRGRYMLIFFGYTHCPDICPTSLSEISGALDQLGPKAEKLVPVFVTVDPARDTPEHLKEYAGHFHKSIRALSGTDAQTKQVTNGYRVYYAKIPDPDGDKDAYFMDHSTIIYLMGPDGTFKQHFSHQTAADELAQKLNAAL